MVITQRLLIVLVALYGASFSSAAIGQPRGTENAWELSLGGGFLASPIFEGAKSYQVSALPSVRLKYKDIFFASIEEGVGANLLSSENWRVGPLVRVAFPRDEDGGSSPFRIAGKTTTALQGLGDVSATPEPGVFLEYQWHEGWSARIEGRHGIGGHSGAVGSVGVAYSKSLRPGGRAGGPPTILSIGVSTSFVSDKYVQSYFGVTPTQALNSGLSEFDAKGGLHSYGANALAVIPIARNVSLTALANVSRLAGDAGRSPLVQERGTKTQATVGLFATYRFGW